MARRGAGGSTDSLDLLLDTVCNAFGGIIFIALLVSILPHRASDEDSSPEQAETSALAGQVEVLRARLSEKERAREILRQSVQTLTDPDAEAVQRELAAVRAEEAEIRGQVEANDRVLRGLAAVIGASVEQLRGHSVPPREQLNYFRREVAEQMQTVQRLAEECRQAAAALTIERELAKTAGEVRKVRLPRARMVNKKNFLLVVCNGRAYLTQRPGAEGLQYTLNEDDFFVEPGRGQIAVTPRPNRGMEVGAWLQSQEKALLLRKAPKDEYVMTLVLFADSLARFNELRDMFVEAGYDYNWLPEAGKSFVIHIGSGRTGTWSQ